MAAWKNWAGNQEMHPVRVEHPRSTDEVAGAVKAAAADGRRVKAIGSGHSFTSIGLTDGVLLQLDRFADPVTVDAGTGLVTVQAGMTLKGLNALLLEHGLSLTNMGDVDGQTVSGAVSTGTHGTGRSSGSVAQQIAALELVLADGSVVTCSRTERPELFEHARIGLGALGVISEVTFQTEPVFALRADERPMPLDEVLEAYDDLVADNEHFEFFWFPHTDVALTKRNNRAEGPLDPLSPRRAWFDDLFLANTVLGGLWAVGSAMPRLVPSLNRLVARLMSPRSYTDVAPRVFVSPRNVRFHETEYAVPRAVLPELVRELRQLPDRLGELVSFPIEVRTAPADDIPLSTAYGRDSAYVAVHQYHRTPYDRWFGAAERLLQEAGGRPHWGKLHSLGHEELRQRYPRFDDFRAVRRSVDPAGLLGNSYLDTVLGPV
jgi:L-gulono-1,4-lactone dehydrogenase